MNINNIQKRFLLFLLGCIPTRILLVILSMNKRLLPIMGYFALIISIGFFYLYFSGSRKTGPEVFGDKIWWNSLRPIHGILYFLFFINATIYHNPLSYLYLLVDVILGLSSFVIYHYYNNDFSNLV